MKFLVLGFISFFLVSCATSSSFKLQKYETLKMENGLEVIFLPDHRLPSFSVVTLFRSGSTTDPLAKSGLSSFVGGMLTRGTKTKSATEFAEAVEQIGAHMNVSVGKDYTIAEANGISFQWKTVLSNYADAIINPSFKVGEIRRYKKQVVASLAKTVDNPSGFTDLAFDSYLYGSHPYARRTLGRPRDVRSFKRKDIIKHYFRYYRPNNAIMAVVGDFKKDEVVAELNTHFGKWKPRKVKPLLYPEFPEIKGRQIQLVNKFDLKQTQIRFGHKGIKRTNPDYIPLRVANTILGGNFSSRLIAEIRIKRGLTYSISSYFLPRLDHGQFAVETFSRHDKVGETVQETLGVIERMRQKGVSAEELNAAKGYMKGVFPRALETPERLAQNLLALKFYGISDDYLTDYIKSVDKVSKSDIDRVLKKYFHPEDIKILVFSNKNKVLSQLRPIGPVKVKSYREFL